MRTRLRDDRERAVVDYWGRGGLSASTVQLYLSWIRRFRKYCQGRKLDELEQSSLSGVERFVDAYPWPRANGHPQAASVDTPRHAIHAWACALRALGESVPPWRNPTASAALPPLLSDYAAYRKAHNGTAETSLRRDLDTARRFLHHLRVRRCPLKRISLRDIDTFVQAIAAARVAMSTVVNACSSLRAFLRFLAVSGRLDCDLASGVMAPRFRASARPPRTLPWSDVKRILRAVRRSDRTGRRDHAILLLLATYGMGAAEVLGLRLEDVDWSAGVLRARRPKTKVSIELPLLPAVAKALAAYLRWERPPANGVTRLFLSRQIPYAPITSGAIRHRIRLYANRAGVTARVLGAHIFRHSHASRQVDAGANLKVVSEILGHRSSSSTSVYVRVALRRLRGVGLPVPR
jgi:integrase/recombinase XerD